MGTQGLVTIMSDKRVLMKVVAGCDGYNAKKLAVLIEKSWPVSKEDAIKLAVKTKFGCPDCLVVITDQDTQEGSEELGLLYFKTFQKPKFNPRWKHGTAPYTKVIKIKK
jgi:hypothetical protein